MYTHTLIISLNLIKKQKQNIFNLKIAERSIIPSRADQLSQVTEARLHFNLELCAHSKPTMTIHDHQRQNLGLSQCQLHHPVTIILIYPLVI